MKRTLILLATLVALGFASWGVGGCGSGGSPTTTADGFPLLGGSYYLSGDVTDECLAYFGDSVAIDIRQSSDQLTLPFTDINTFTSLFQCEGTTDQDANIEFSGTTGDGSPISCTATVIIEGAANEDRTLPLTCTVGDLSCEVTYSDH